MRLFRLCRQKYTDLTGYGAKKTGGRWNRKGIAALYTAENASLAVVEVLVHLDRTEIPPDFVLLQITIAEEFIMALPDTYPGERLYEDGSAALPPGIVGFLVRSAVVPLDRIVVLYPDSPAYSSAVQTAAITPFAFDPRLFSRPAYR